MQGGEKEAKGLDVPEFPDKYPESAMFGILPSYGFYMRHAAGLTMNNVQVRCDNADERPSIIFDDVKALDMDGFRAGTASSPSHGVDE